VAYFQRCRSGASGGSPFVYDFPRGPLSLDFLADAPIINRRPHFRCPPVSSGIVSGLGNLHGELHAIGKVSQPSPGNSQCTLNCLTESENDNVGHRTPLRGW
jgi:hypothetical protein